ncbi:Pkinase-domain-containing protein [Poronia punctata]|nr:Pkinase-domain-containing protein [Poronia punctata]
MATANMRPSTPNQVHDTVHTSTHSQSLPVLPSTSVSPSQPSAPIETPCDPTSRPTLGSHLSAPSPFPSPLRHHKRTPSQHREIKETLNAKYINDEVDGEQLEVINQYILKEEIGSGSYASVYLAVDQFGNEYAVKKFSKARLRKRAQSHILRRPGPGRPHPSAPGTGLNYFHKRQFSRQENAEARDALHFIRAEIAIMKKLNHPNLVALIEVLDDPDDDSMYMVLEMCKKGVVMKIGLDKEAEPHDSETCRLEFRDLILGIEYLHAQGIIHRDIKPDNLLMTEDDVLKIVDFGVSEMFQRQDEMVTNKSAGSPAFIPPELCQAKHGEISGRAADIWSMGVTLYCLKYGKLPFNGDSIMGVYEAIREKPLVLPDGEDPDFFDLMTRILDKNSTTRITLPEIRNHPWVTKNGTDPLLSEQENCSNPVEEPNELEMNHAFTRRMGHLVHVIRAIQRFKHLISKSRVSTPKIEYVPKPLAKKAKSELWPATPQTPKQIQPGQSSQTTEPERQRSVAEEAADLVEQRKAYLRSGPSLAGSEPLAEPAESGDSGTQTPVPADKGPIILGIGVGGRDGFSISEPATATVSESPTGIDFNVYDRAFETEIQRIRSDKVKSRARTYMTKLVGEKEKYVGDDYMIVEAGKSLAASAISRGSSALSGRLSSTGSQSDEGTGRGAAPSLIHDGAHKAVGVASQTGSKLTDLVLAAAQDMKSKSQG